ncbi:MAG: GDP-mannose 4,6-dehydratase [Magnetococcales bacterium]|nr:GDP-mannose 4,6-dehydratase [Magnetococcales bacterium]
MKRALITGITGQDGSYLAEHLLQQGYQVHGLLRDPDSASGKPYMVALRPRVIWHALSGEGFDGLEGVIEAAAPDECYHLGAPSFVHTGPAEEATLLRDIVEGSRALLSAVARHRPQCRFFLAGSAEMFGRPDHSPQNLDTPFRPRSVYGVAKVAAHHLVRLYREERGLFACTGILYNHESPRRSPRFVTRKVTRAAARIGLGLQKELVLGNLDHRRDWGYAPDYVAAMQVMLTAGRAADFIIATGRTRTVAEMVALAFACAGLDWCDHVHIDPELLRPPEPVPLCGDASAIRESLGWEPRRGFEEIIGEMVRADRHRAETESPETSD